MDYNEPKIDQKLTQDKLKHIKHEMECLRNGSKNASHMNLRLKMDQTKKQKA